MRRKRENKQQKVRESKIWLRFFKITKPEMQNSTFSENGESNAPPFKYWTIKRKPSVVCRNVFSMLQRFFVFNPATTIIRVTSVPHLADCTPNPVKHTSAYGRTRLAIGGFPFQSPGTDPGRWEGDLIETILHLQRRDAAGKHSNKRTCSGTDSTIPGT